MVPWAAFLFMNTRGPRVWSWRRMHDTGLPVNGSGSPTGVQHGGGAGAGEKGKYYCFISRNYSILMVFLFSFVVLTGLGFLQHLQCFVPARTTRCRWPVLVLLRQRRRTSLSSTLLAIIRYLVLFLFTHGSLFTFILLILV